MIWMRKLPWAALAAAFFAAPALGQSIEVTQQQLYVALKAQGVISSETKLILASPVCTLTVGRRLLRVINVVEHVPGAQVPRARNQIVLLDPRLKLVRRLDYADQRPLACRGPRLFVWGDYGVNNAAPYGNVLEFRANGDIAVSSVDANDLPIPLTRNRPAYRLQ
jgi:hypothetical protein